MEGISYTTAVSCDRCYLLLVTRLTNVVLETLQIECCDGFVE